MRVWLEAELGGSRRAPVEDLVTGSIYDDEPYRPSDAWAAALGFPAFELDDLAAGECIPHLERALGVDLTAHIVPARRGRPDPFGLEYTLEYCRLWPLAILRVEWD